jgi:hypothetical protein
VAGAGRPDRPGRRAGQLRPAQALALRYADLLLVYLSSTADLFLTGLGRGMQLPIALAVLAVAGVPRDEYGPDRGRLGWRLVAAHKPRPGTPRTEGGAVVGKELIAAPDATPVRVFKNSIRAVHPPPGEGQVVWLAGHVVRG